MADLAISDKIIADTLTAAPTKVTAHGLPKKQLLVIQSLVSNYTATKQWQSDCPIEQRNLARQFK